MNMKKFFTFLSLFLIFACCISAIGAVSDEHINSAVADFDESQECISINDEDVIDAEDSEILSDSQDDDVLEETDEDEIAVDGTAGTITPYQKFVNDLENQLTTITLIGSFTITEQFNIDHSVVIDGAGYTIDAQKKSGIFKSHNALTLKNIVLKNGNSDSEGGAVYCTGSLVVEGCTFINNVANRYGGALASNGASLTVNNCNFETNTVTSATGLGGAIWVNSGVARISKSSFSSGKADIGGAIYSNNQLIVDSCTFNSNYARSYGGAIGDTRGSLTVTNSKFSKNTVPTSSGFGGAIWVNEANAKVSKSTFNSGKADIGGAIYSNSNLNVDECTFNSNYASTYGGAIGDTRGSLTVTNSDFDKNTVPTSSGLGGSIWVNSASAKVSKSTFTSGKANIGGAIYSNSKLTVDGCTFKNNVVPKYGGAIGILHGSLTVSGSNFEKNTVTSSGSAGYGGAIWIFDSKSSISKSTFKYNTCISKSLKNHKKATKYKFSGGAIEYTEGSTHTLSGCTFIGNKASNHGGSILAVKSKLLKINKCTFNNNRAVYEDGGAISFAGKKLVLTKSNFNKNLAYEDGGAIDSFGVTSKKVHVTIKKCNFVSNTGYKCGGAIWMGVKTVYNVANSKFIKNKASSAGAIEAESGSAKITKCLFKSNKAAKITSWTVKTKSGGRLSHSGGAILVKNKCTVVKCKFKGNKAKYGKNIKVEGGKLTRK